MDIDRSGNKDENMHVSDCLAVKTTECNKLVVN